jgi:cytochrome c oxidase subunit 4
MHATAAALRIVRRGLATAAAHPPHAAAASSAAASTTTVSAASAIPLSNVEAQWASLSSSEQAVVHQQLEELQQKDWKTLSLSEKKAGASVSMQGGPRFYLFYIYI